MVDISVFDDFHWDSLIETQIGHMNKVIMIVISQNMWDVYCNPTLNPTILKDHKIVLVIVRIWSFQLLWITMQ